MRIRGAGASSCSAGRAGFQAEEPRPWRSLLFRGTVTAVSPSRRRCAKRAPEAATSAVAWLPLTDRLSSRLGALRDWWQHPRPGESVTTRSARQLLTADSRDRVFMLAGQAFIALVPLILVVASALGASGSDLGAEITTRFSLEGELSETVRGVFERPAETTSGAGIASLGLLLIVVNSFARSVRRTFESAWGLSPSRGRTAALSGLLAVAVLMATSAAVTGLRGLAGDAAWWVLPAFGLPGQMALAFTGWWVATWLLLTGRVDRALLLPGAVFASAAQLAADWVSGVYLPISLARNADRYGGIGVAISLVYWLLIIAALVVSVAVVGAELTRRRRRWAAPASAAGPAGSRTAAAASDDDATSGQQP